jgi:hypothetical protein
MKKTKIIAFLLLASALAANAQITKGNWMVGGDGNYTNSKTINPKNEIISSGNSIRLFPNIGYFIVDKLVLGVNVNFNYGKNVGIPSNTAFGAGPFIRYYFLKPEKKINLFTDANIIFYTSKTQGSDSENTNSYRFKAGSVIYLNSSVGLEITLNYKSQKLFYTSKYFTIGIGFQIHLEK